MKFYIASRMRHKDEVKNLIEDLEDKDHVCTHNWTEVKGLKPYGENLNQSQELADKQVEAVKSCDFFILLNPDEGGTGMYVELGVALAEDKQVFIVGEFKKPVFLFHPSVKQVSDTEELLKLIN